MRANEVVSEYFNKELGKESHSLKLLTLLMDYWATEKDYEIKSDLLTQVILRYSVAERKLDELNMVKNKFIRLAAHDLRNPLISIRGLSEILLEEVAGGLKEHQKDYLNTIFTASSTMLSLVNDILDISAIENGGIELQFKPNSLKEVLCERIRIHKIIADKKDINLKHKLCNLPEFSFDRNRISQVIDNLIGNAIKFTPPGKNIHVSMRRLGTAARVSVRDEGPGIREAELSKLFGEFQTLGTQPTGGEKCTGLGLSIAKKLVDEHSGNIEVKSSVGSGTIFSFTIPMEI